MTRRLLSLLLVAALVAACGSGDGTDAATEPEASGDAADAEAPAGDGACPRTVEHAMGSTEIPARPERRGRPRHR